MRYILVIDILGDSGTNPSAVLNKCIANTFLEYLADYFIIVTCSLMSGQCEIMNGTLTNRIGVLHLFLDDPPVLSGLSHIDASATFLDDAYARPVAIEPQVCLQYTCQFSHAADENTTRHKDYDKGVHPFVRGSGGASVFMLFSLGNIPHTIVGVLLVGTSLDFGVPASLPAIVASAVFRNGVFGVIFVILYRVHQSEKTHKGLRKERGPPYFRRPVLVWESR